jgi:Uma2 family endonuclease
MAHCLSNADRHRIDLTPDRIRLMTLTTQRRMSLEEYLTYDDGTDTHYELVDGVLVEMGTETPLNSAIALFLAFIFADLGTPRKNLAIGHQQ